MDGGEEIVRFGGESRERRTLGFELLGDLGFLGREEP
jgi:hypothetical protein